MAQLKREDVNRKALQGGVAWWTLMCVVVALSAAFGVVAWARDGEGGGHAHHAGTGGPGFFGPGLFSGGPERIERTVDRLLDGLQATDAQRAQVKQIATVAASDLKAQREAGRSLHERSLQLFTTPVIDANAAEQLRQQMLAQHDQASRRALQAMLDISSVLSPGQRATLAQRIADHMQHGRGPHAEGASFDERHGLRFETIPPLT